MPRDDEVSYSPFFPIFRLKKRMQERRNINPYENMSILRGGDDATVDDIVVSLSMCVNRKEYN